jgi:hypothetical protein
MNNTFRDVAAAVASWRLEKVVEIREINGKTEITYEGEIQRYPHWLAVNKVNQIGVDYKAPDWSGSQP